MLLWRGIMVSIFSDKSEKKKIPCRTDTLRYFSEDRHILLFTFTWATSTYIIHFIFLIVRKLRYLFIRTHIKIGMYVPKKPITFFDNKMYLFLFLLYCFSITHVGMLGIFYLCASIINITKTLNS